MCETGVRYYLKHDINWSRIAYHKSSGMKRYNVDCRKMMVLSVITRREHGSWLMVDAAAARRNTVHFVKLLVVSIHCTQPHVKIIKCVHRQRHPKILLVANQVTQTWCAAMLIMG